MSDPENATAAAQHGPRVLVIEDDEAVARAIVRGIERAAMPAAWAGTGALGVALKNSFRPQIVLVDLTLPDMSGLALISRFVGQRDCGVVVVSGSGEEADRIVGLELGADDYIVKPMSMSEMVARIRAVHRRVNLPKPSNQQETSAPAPDLEIGPICIDVARRMAHTRDGRRLALTSAEFTALELLARAGGAIVSRDVNQRRCGTQRNSAFSTRCGADQHRSPLLTHKSQAQWTSGCRSGTWPGSSWR